MRILKDLIAALFATGDRFPSGPASEAGYAEPTKRDANA